MEIVPTLGNLIKEIDKILDSIPKSTYPDYAKTFKGTLIEKVILIGYLGNEVESDIDFK